MRQYFTTVGGNRWRFYCMVKDKEGNKSPLYLRDATETKIRRHKKILANATPFNPQFKEYFKKRGLERRTRENVSKNSKYAGLRIIQPYAGLSGVP